MARYRAPENPYSEVMYEGDECVEFETVGKYKVKVIVDKALWYRYLSAYSWTVQKKSGRLEVKTSVSKQSNRIWRVIIEHEYDELDCWGTTVDHINNNPLDNRLQNLRIFNTAILNSTNIASKYSKDGLQYIYKNGLGYKVHYNLGGRTFYKYFGRKEWGSTEAALIAAKQYRDEVVLKAREQIIEEMMEKARNIEFERGLRDKLRCHERDEVVAILQKYGFNVS